MVLQREHGPCGGWQTAVKGRRKFATVCRPVRAGFLCSGGLQNKTAAQPRIECEVKRLTGRLWAPPAGVPKKKPLNAREDATSNGCWDHSPRFGRSDATIHFANYWRGEIRARR